MYYYLNISSSIINLNVSINANFSIIYCFECARRGHKIIHLNFCVNIEVLREETPAFICEPSNLTLNLIFMLIEYALFHLYEH